MFKGPWKRKKPWRNYWIPYRSLKTLHGSFGWLVISIIVLSQQIKSDQVHCCGLVTSMDPWETARRENMPLKSSWFWFDDYKHTVDGVKILITIWYMIWFIHVDPLMIPFFTVFHIVTSWLPSGAGFRHHPQHDELQMKWASTIQTWPTVHVWESGKQSSGTEMDIICQSIRMLMCLTTIILENTGHP